MATFSEAQLDAILSGIREHQQRSGISARSKIAAGIDTVAVVDNGSGMMLCGFAGDDNPRCSVAGTKGVADDWDDLAARLERAFRELTIDPRKTPVLLSEPPQLDAKRRAVAVALLFETFGVPALYLMSRAALTLVGRGHSSGIVFDAGDGVSHLVAVHEGRPLAQATARVDLAKMEAAGIHELTQATLAACREDVRATLYSNVVLAGYSGIPERVEKGLVGLAPTSMKIGAVAPTERTNTSWLGGSLLARSAAFRSLWITKDEYDENGPGIVARKSF